MGVSKKTQNAIKAAAELRANGNDWSTVAKMIGRKDAKSAQHLVYEYPDLWRAEFEYRRAIIIDGLEIKALTRQEELLRCGDPKVEESAAHSIMQHAAKMRTQKVSVEDQRKAQADVVVDFAAVGGNTTDDDADNTPSLAKASG